ncbi:MAG: hypothetical protein J6I64_04740, partial [Lachnospiraceae bacterium]|nr:hypothetical protein [Lachnospiraceae bacterium]
QRAGEPVCQDPPRFVQTPLRDKTAWDMLEQRIRASHHQAALEMLDNSQLNMFYVSKYMQDNVYYCESSDTYVIAERDGDSLVIHMVISDREQDLCQIADGLVASLADSIRDSEGVELRLVKLGFTPKDPHGFVCRELDQEDCMFFGKGDLTVIETEKLMFPSLAHA